MFAAELQAGGQRDQRGVVQSGVRRRNQASTKVGRPSVSVPVLSNATQRSPCAS